MALHGRCHKILVLGLFVTTLATAFGTVWHTYGPQPVSATQPSSYENSSLARGVAAGRLAPMVYPNMSLSEPTKGQELADFFAEHLGLPAPIEPPGDLSQELQRIRLIFRDTALTGFGQLPESYQTRFYESSPECKMQLYYDEVSSPARFFAAVIALNSPRFVASSASDYAPESLRVLNLIGVPTGGLEMSLWATVGKTSVIYSTNLWNLSLAMSNIASVTFDDETGRISNVQTTAFVLLPSYGPVSQAGVMTIGRAAAAGALLNKNDEIVGGSVEGIRFLYTRVAGNNSGGSWPAFGYEYVANVRETRHAFNYSILVVVDTESGNAILVKLGMYPTFYEQVVLARWLPMSLIVFSILLMILGLVAVSPEFAYALVASVIVPLFMRLKGSNILDSFNRGRIHGFITAMPGCSYSSIKEAVGIGNGTLSYHLLVLERMELIKSIKDGRVRRFFPSGVPTSLRQGQCLGRTEAQVLQTLVERGPLTNSSLAQSLGISRQRTHYNLRLLSRRGLAVQEYGAWMPVRPEGESGDHRDAEEPPGPNVPPMANTEDPGESPELEAPRQTSRT